MKSAYPIGKKCKKFRRKNKKPKPFKSGKVINPYNIKMGYSFEEDESIVNCDQIVIVD